MAHRSRATSLRRTSQSAAASRALSVPSASSCRTLVLSRVTFFIGRCRSTRTLSLKDRRGELRIQRSHRRASTPKARRKKTCRARRRPRYHSSRRSTLPVVLPDASRSRSHRRALTPKARRKKTCRARRRPRYHPSRRSTLLLPDASRSRHVAFEAKPENLIGDRAYDSLLRLARCGAILRRSCLLFIEPSILTSRIPGGRRFRRCHWIQAKKRSLNPTQSQGNLEQYSLSAISVLAERALQRSCQGESPIGDRFDAWLASARCFARCTRTPPVSTLKRVQLPSARAEPAGGCCSRGSSCRS